MTFDRTKPFALAALPPAAMLETRPVLKKLIAAREALAELKHLGKLLPNQAILIQSIGLHEAKLSSEIENIVTTHDALYRAFFDDGSPVDAATKEVLAYKDALWWGFEQVRAGRPLSTSTFESLVGTIKGTAIGVRRLPGTKLANALGEVIYTPPEGETILRDLLANLECFIHGVSERGEPDGLDLDPLVRMAVMHYQFEAIHPFADGNGRTGRILNILFLIEQKLLDLPVLFLSQYILERRAAYYQGLQGVTEHGEWESWILYMLDAVEHMARATAERVQAIVTLMEETRLLVQRDAPKIYSKDLVELLFQSAYTKVSTVEAAQLGNRVTAASHLRTLVKLGVLSEHRIGRELYFLNIRFWGLLAARDDMIKE